MKLSFPILPVIFSGVMIISSSTGLASNPKQPLHYEALLDSAENLTRSNAWAEAAELYREALRTNPGSPLNSKIFSNLGLCLTHIGKYQDAIEAYDIALIKEPHSAPILAGKGATLLIKGDVESSRDCLEEALRVDSLYPGALRLHGQIMLMENNPEQAESDFSRLIKADPMDPWGPAGMGEVQIAQNHHQEAIPLFAKAIQLGESPDFHISMISAMLKANRLADAENAIREGLIIYPTQGELYLLRAVLHKTLHQNRDVETDKKYAVEYGIDPQIIERYLQFYSE